MTGSTDVSDCKLKRPCTKDDYEAKYDFCNPTTNKRNRLYFWKQPLLCDEKHIDSVYLPEAEVELPCRSCAKGEYLDPELQECYFCTEGFY